jgi:hypothetical protein
MYDKSHQNYNELPGKKYSHKYITETIHYTNIIHFLY